MPCEDLEGWDVRGSGRGLKREGIYIYLELIHVVVQQKLTQHCKAIILQLKKNRIDDWDGGRALDTRSRWLLFGAEPGWH